MCTAGVCVHDGSVRVQGKCVCTMGVYMCPVGVGVHDGGRGVHDGDVCVQGRCVCMMGVYVCARWGCMYAWGCGYAQQVTCLTVTRLLHNVACVCIVGVCVYGRSRASHSAAFCSVEGRFLTRSQDN